MIVTFVSIILVVVTLRCYSMRLSMNIGSDLYKSDFKGPSPLWYSPLMVEHSKYIIESYYKLCGVELVDLTLLDNDPFDAAKQLFFKDNLIVLSHGVQKDPDGPILNYGNSAALKRW